MIYCFSFKQVSDTEMNEKIKRAQSLNCFSYYQSENKVFLNQFDEIIDLNGKEVFPVLDILNMKKVITALIEVGAIIPNSLEDIHKVLHWYQFIEPIRTYIPFTGDMLHDKAFLTYLWEVFSDSQEVFLKTVQKDFNGIIDFSSLFDENSDLRKAFSYHENDEFILSNKILVDEDKIGKQEYRVFVYDRNIMNISRVTNTTYHKIPNSVLEYAKEVITSLPIDFPRSFVLDIFKYQNTLDILEFNPIEVSGCYLYNSVFDFASDLLHRDMLDVPAEKDKTNLSYTSSDMIKPSNIDKISHSFAKDYHDIRRFGDRVDGYIHISGLNPNSKINLQELFSSSSFEEMEDMPTLSLRKKDI